MIEQLPSMNNKNSAKHAAIIALLLGSQIVHAQSDALLEACNSIEDKAKRLNCLKQLNSLQNNSVNKSPDKTNQENAIIRAKGSFAAMASSVRSGLSYNSYSQLVLDPAKELGVLRATAPALNSYVFDKLEESVTAYNDAARVWHAGIFKSQDGGIFFGKVLNPDRADLTSIVYKYQLYTTTVLMNPHLPYEQALIVIWKRAEDSAREAFDFIENPPNKNPQEIEKEKTEAENKAFEPQMDDESIVERLAKASGCNTHPVAAHTGTIAGKREYAVYCSKGNTIFYKCQNRQCSQ